MSYSFKLVTEVDEKLFEPLGAHRRMEMRNGGDLVIDEEQGSYILEFSEKMYIPENVRSDEKIPHSNLSYFIIRYADRFIGLETQVSSRDISLSSKDYARTILLLSSTLYIPYSFDGIENKLTGICKKMVLIDFATRAENLSQNDPSLGSVKMTGIEMEEASFIRVPTVEDI